MEDGEEGRGRGRAKRASTIPDHFEPVLSEAIAAMVANWPNGMMERELAKFRDHHTAKGSVMKDWQAALRTWLRNADEWGNRNAGNRNNSGSGNGLLDAALGELGERGRSPRG